MGEHIGVARLISEHYGLRPKQPATVTKTFGGNDENPQIYFEFCVPMRLADLDGNELVPEGAA